MALFFPSTLVNSAKAAGIKVPENLESFDANDFPHWKVFCNLQLGQPLPYATAHHDNAKVIAKIPEDKIRTIEIPDILQLGFVSGFSQN